MSYNHLTSEEHYVIFHLTRYGLSIREIGRRLNRHHSSISRELRRNSLEFFGYCNDGAQKRAQERRHKARHQRRRSNSWKARGNHLVYLSSLTLPVSGDLYLSAIILPSDAGYFQTKIPLTPRKLR